MQYVADIFANHMLICAVISYFAAQIIKVFINLFREKKLDLSLIVSSGGMPSSHSSTVVALAISAARCYGVGSPLFAITSVLAGIVMYDAAGVRRAAGEHAKVLNRLLEDLASPDQELAEKSLKELLGHTPLQVVCGALLGFAVAMLFPLPAGL